MFMNVLLGILSEVILSVGIIFIILLDIFLNDSNSKKFISRVSLSVLLLSILSVVCNINYYLKEANLFLDDDLPLDNDKVSEIYEKITSDDDIVNSIGRIWDEDDKNNILGKLNEYTTLYGKKNLIPALNFVKEDNNAFKKYRDDKIDEEIKRYSGNLSKILK